MAILLDDFVPPPQFGIVSLLFIPLVWPFDEWKDQAAPVKDFRASVKKAFACRLASAGFARGGTLQNQQQSLSGLVVVSEKFPPEGEGSFASECQSSQITFPFNACPR